MKNANRPAHPLPDPDLTNAPQYQGLSKRERFAMAAMQGMLANERMHDDMNASVMQGGNATEELAVASINFADTLLAELEKTEEL